MHELVLALVLESFYTRYVMVQLSRRPGMTRQVIDRYAYHDVLVTMDPPPSELQACLAWPHRKED